MSIPVCVLGAFSLANFGYFFLQKQKLKKKKKKKMTKKRKRRMKKRPNLTKSLRILLPVSARFIL